MFDTGNEKHAPRFTVFVDGLHIKYFVNLSPAWLVAVRHIGKDRKDRVARYERCHRRRIINIAVTISPTLADRNIRTQRAKPITVDYSFGVHRFLGARGASKQRTLDADNRPSYSLVTTVAAAAAAAAAAAVASDETGKHPARAHDTVTVARRHGLM